MDLEDLLPGTKPEEARKGLEMLLSELEKLRDLNFRSPAFARWKQVVALGLKKFYGSDHKVTTEWLALEFHSTNTKSPMDPPVSQKDMDAYAESMQKTAYLLALLIDSLKQPPPPMETPPIATIMETADADLVPAPTQAPVVESEFKLVRSNAQLMAKMSGVEAPPALPSTTASPEIRSQHDLTRHANVQVPTEGGLKIMSRGASNTQSTLDQYIVEADDKKERELLMVIKKALDNPQCTWATARTALGELHLYKRETLLKILNVLLRV
jgi:hypothetical protein